MSELLTLGEAVATHSRVRPHKLAVRDSKRELTFAAWHERGNRLANGLLDLGLDRGERVIAAHPDVKDVAVIGVPDEKWGEAVHAVVILHEGQGASESDIIEWCRSRVAGYKRPRSVAFIAEADMPRTATGKIQHRVLRDRYEA